MFMLLFSFNPIAFMHIRLRTVPAGVAVWLGMILSIASCQRAGMVSPPTAYRATTPVQPHLLVVKGQLIRGNDTLKPIRTCRVIFSRKLPDNQIESVFDSVSMPATGHYRVRLHANQSYQAALIVEGHNIEVHEFDMPASIPDSVLVHDFRLGYN